MKLGSIAYRAIRGCENANEVADVLGFFTVYRNLWELEADDVLLYPVPDDRVIDKMLNYKESESSVFNMIGDILEKENEGKEHYNEDY